MNAVLNFLGIALQIAGVTVTALGVRRTWREYGPEGEGWWDPLIRWVVRSGKCIHTKLRLFFGRILRSLRFISDTEAHSASSTLTGSVILTAQARMQFRVLTPLNIGKDIAELDVRTRELMDKIYDVWDEVADIEVVLKSVCKRLDSAIAEMKKRDRHVAVGGLRLEACGLFLLALGLLSQGLAALL